MEWRGPPAVIRAGGTADFEGVNRGGAFVTSVWRLSDQWAIEASGELTAPDTPLRALRNGIWADGATLGVVWRHSDLRQAAAARDSGRHQEAVGSISRGMARLAALADRLDPEAGRLMRHLIQRFRVALEHGHPDDARRAADVMREMSGAQIIEPGDASRGGGEKSRR